MPGNAAKVVVTERQENLLTEFSKSRSVSRQLAERATMVLLSFEGLSNEEIAQRVGVNRLQVGLWRRRWRDNWESLTLLECPALCATFSRPVTKVRQQGSRMPETHWLWPLAHSGVDFGAYLLVCERLAPIGTESEVRIPCIH